MTAEPSTVSERGNRLSGLSIRRENQAYAALFLIPTAALFIASSAIPSCTRSADRHRTFDGAGPPGAVRRPRQLAPDHD